MSTSSIVNEMTIEFPEGQRVDAFYGDLCIPTDQPSAAGEAAGCPAPFDLFLASLGTCAGFYVLSFCRTRGISTAGVSIRQRWERDPESRRITRITQELILPASFPRKYDDALVRAAEHCSVKRLVDDPPQFELAVLRSS